MKSSLQHATFQYRQFQRDIIGNLKLFQIFVTIW